MKILILGGFGFLGNKIYNELLKTEKKKIYLDYQGKINLI